MAVATIDIVEIFKKNQEELHDKLGIDRKIDWSEYYDTGDKVFRILEEHENRFSQGEPLVTRAERVLNSEGCIPIGNEVMGLGTIIWWVVFGNFIDRAYEKYPPDKKRKWRGKPINKKVRNKPFYAIDWFVLLEGLDLLEFERGKPKTRENSRVKFCKTRLRQHPKLNTFATWALAWRRMKTIIEVTDGIVPLWALFFSWHFFWAPFSRFVNLALSVFSVKKN